MKKSKTVLIVKHQITPPKEYKFTFSIPENLITCVNLIKDIKTKIKQSHEETYEMKIPTDEKKKDTILEKNPELKLIYHEFVSQGAISDSEFWNLKKVSEKY